MGVGLRRSRSIHSKRRSSRQKAQVVSLGRGRVSFAQLRQF